MKRKQFDLSPIFRPVWVPWRARALLLATGRMAALSLLGSAMAYSAPLLPDAGQILESVRPAPAAPAARPALPQREEASRPALSGPDTVQIPLRGIRITGATLYPAATLEALLHDAIGGELTLRELDALAQRITRYYRDHDCMLARAYIPAQDIKEGIVEIAVLEGQFGEIVLRNQSGLKDRAARALTRPLPPGRVITGRAVERVTLLADDLHGIEAAATLRPGSVVGTSDFVLELREGKPRDGSLEFDNSGSRYTGRYRLGGSIAFNNPAGIGDRFSARVLSSGEGLIYGQLGYQMPLGYSGTTLGLSLTQADYQLGSDFANLDASGTARIAGVTLNHALIRSTQYNLRGRIGFDYKKLRDRIAASGTDKQSRAVSLGLLGDLDGQYGKSNFSALLYSGNLDAPATAAGASGGFNKLTLSASHQRYLGSGFSFTAAYSGQLASKNLDSSEKMSLGGPNGVRAYPQAEAAGDDAHLINLELRYALDPLAQGSLDLMLLADFGVSRLVHDTWAGYTGESVRRLSSVGLGLAYKTPGDWRLRADYAWRLGSQSAQSEPDSSGRFWLQVVKLF
ncbi:MAG: ShlB/FhaC/HecB family hemolysin secretion/activation protein [Gallionellaceae bacterium]|nr:ShlB/FhaC/HecB family hemolysin secretion/activation protein [Gallionellaceae bacterium]